jgi:hypothetical protein
MAHVCVAAPAAGLPLARTPFRKKIMAPRGPRSDWWVVVVTMSQWGKGVGIAPPATRPA